MNASGFASVLADRLSAPGVPAQPSEKDQAVVLARRILENHAADDPYAGLARQFLRALGLSAQG